MIITLLLFLESETLIKIHVNFSQICRPSFISFLFFVCNLHDKMNKLLLGKIVNAWPTISLGYDLNYLIGQGLVNLVWLKHSLQNVINLWRSKLILASQVQVEATFQTLWPNWNPPYIKICMQILSYRILWLIRCCILEDAPRLLSLERNF